MASSVSIKASQKDFVPKKWNICDSGENSVLLHWKQDEARVQRQKDQEFTILFSYMASLSYIRLCLKTNGASKMAQQAQEPAAKAI